MKLLKYTRFIKLFQKIALFLDIIILKVHIPFSTAFMKSFLYISLLAVAVMLPRSERVRNAAFEVTTVIFTGVNQILFKDGYAEVRMVDADEFDEVINEQNRIVIVDFHHEDISVAKSDKSELDASINRLPSKILVAKVLVGRNMELLDRLQIRNLPTLRVYREGQLLEEFKGKVDKDKFLEVVQYHLDHPNSSPHRGGYIGPVKNDWLPEGVELRSSSSMTPLNPNSK